ncbi:hypothetical protein KJ612_07015 [Myxococcota bacterium]|nr:hypothetical protein [Myxococcota bacterium]MBU1413537.1 hypothetical protein [Myxococcota bacterium]
MTFIKHTESWYKGEAFEFGMLIIFGTLLVILALYFWKFGHTSTSRVLVIPFLVVGLFWGIAGGFGTYRNSVRVEKMRVDYKQDPGAFVKSEKKRVEGFRGWYRPLLIGWTVLVLIGLSLFHFWGGNLGRAIGLAAILFAVAGLMVDHTSEHNARVYHAEIERALGP